MRNRPSQLLRQKSGYLTITPQLRAENQMIGIMRFLIRQRAESNGRDVVRGDEREFSGSGCGDDL